MDELLASLIEIFGDDHPLVETLRSRGDGDQPFAEADDDRLDQAIDALRSLPDHDVDADVLEAAVETATEIRAEIDTRLEAREAAQAQRDEAAARLAALTGEADDEPEEPEEPTGEGDDPAGDPPAEEPEEPTAEAETPETEPETATEPEAADEREPVAAAAPPRPRRRLARPNPMQANAGAPLVAAASVPTFPAGQRLGSLPDVGRAFEQRHRTYRGDDRAIVASASRPYAPERQLGQDGATNTARMEGGYDAAQNRARDLIDRALWAQDPRGPEMRALVADGGICAPPEARYEFFEAGTAARPLRDALVSFQATRGGVRFVPPSIPQDLVAGITTVTETQDQDASVDKACVEVACPTETTVQVQAIAKCLQYGNFDARFYPERINHLLAKLAQIHAREAEDALWNSIVTDSTAVTEVQLATPLAATRDWLEALGRWAAYFRDRHRLDDSTVFRHVAPRGLRELLRGDMARQMPGDNTYAVTDAMLAQWAAARGVLLTWTFEAGDDPFVFLNGQGAGNTIGWNTDVEVLFYPEGSHIFLDGGTLDLGLVRDSTLNASNNVQNFAETFEETALIGPESWSVTLDICPNGMAAGTHNNDGAYDPCGAGS